ncbi:MULTISPECIES: Fur family transcriptional regulator [unclassified Spirosoma]|uniref:Fur family transcriptional regulator n=1 Tax=unclassified Spirosoma TaxID=2621999 RepID=UPI0009622331|nr:MULTISPECIES: transcriptional repressor [unclassified Spirosoma]MBN8820535.1 transcriptional repressor [Spirosoma sp.]OJW71324.1 MAG: transcriptional repressor [Spirosoma sp. 48-14]
MQTSSTLLATARIKFEDWLLAKGLRRSGERFAILDEVYSRNDHFDAEDLFKSMQAKSYRVSRATVYNTLDVLIECGLIIRHQFGDDDNAKYRYEKSLGRQQHAHLVCTLCHRVKEFCDPRLHLIKTHVGKALQFQVVSHSLVFYGQCTDEACEARLANLAKED